MGSENSVLNDCDPGEAIEHPHSEDWSLRPAVTAEGQHVSLFVHKGKDKKEVDLLKLCSQQLRSLRHPYIIHFVASGKNTDGSFLMTEEVTPVCGSLKSLSPEEMFAGLHNILEALSFLHDTVKVSHNNVCLSALYRSRDGSWRLAGFEHACKMQEASSEFLEKCRAFRDEHSITPEEKDNRYELSLDHGHSRDMYAFGVLADYFLDFVGDVGDLTKTFEIRVQDECLSPDPKSRLKADSLLKDRVFRNDFQEILDFLKHVTLKSKDEKDCFFKSLLPKLIALPEDLVARRLAKQLLSRFVLLDETAVACVIRHLLTPRKGDKKAKDFKGGEITPVLSIPYFRAHVLTEIYKIFHIHDFQIRLVLLENFSSYAHLFDKESLTVTILPQILYGLRDMEDRLVSASLRALGDLVPILGGDIVIGGERGKLFSAGTPKFSSPSVRGMKDLVSVSSTMGRRGKVLLKDLAAGTMSKMNGGVHNLQGASEDKELKRQEREKRREETRIRRENRKKQLQERKEKFKDGHRNDSRPVIIRGTDSTDEDQCDEVAGEETRSSQHSDQMYPEEMIDAVDDEVWAVHSDDENWQDCGKGGGAPSETRTDSLSNYVEGSDGSVSDEIEKELENMPSTISPKSPRTVGNFSEFQRKGSPPNSPIGSGAKQSRGSGRADSSEFAVISEKDEEISKADWSMQSTSKQLDHDFGQSDWSNSVNNKDKSISDISEGSKNKQSKRGALKLSKAPTKKAREKKEAVKKSKNDHENAMNTPRSPGSAKSPHHGKRSSSESDNPIKKNAPGEIISDFSSLNKNISPNQQSANAGLLGAEFDIKSMKINMKKTLRQSSVEPDFFADMIPAIEKPGKVPVSHSGEQQTEKSWSNVTVKKTISVTRRTTTPISPVKQKAAISFAMKQDSSEVADGWGGDDWGADDF